MSAEQYQQARLERELDERNRPLTDEELDAIMPTTGDRGFLGLCTHAPSCSRLHIDLANDLRASAYAGVLQCSEEVR